MTEDNSTVVTPKPLTIPQVSHQGNLLTRSRPFRALVRKAYDVCDIDHTGEVSATELYAGLLLVHLNLAKYAGPAACYPPTREVCNQLFQAADQNHSGGIDQDEFVKIMGICCAQILSRMLVYYMILILLVPTLAARVVDHLKIVNGSYEEMAAEQVISITLFFVAIPFLWNNIDNYSQRELKRPPKPMVAATVTAATSVGDKEE